MRIGITGVAGFVGSNFIHLLKKGDHTLEIFDGDILCGKDVDGFFRGCDIVVHLAGIFDGDFDSLINVNVRGTKNIVDECIRSGVKKIIFSSTGAVYGEPKRMSSFEDDPLSPNTLYGLSKMYAEEYIAYSGINCTTLRFSSIYGPGNKKGVIYNFLDSIKKNKKITIYGTGDQKRNFLFIDDAMRALMTIIDDEKVSGVFNIAGSETASLNEIVHILREENLNFDVLHKKIDKSNVLHILSEDIANAKKVLGWEPKINIRKGIKSILREYEK